MLLRIKSTARFILQNWETYTSKTGESGILLHRKRKLPIAKVKVITIVIIIM
jgi:hypothetical protein